MSGISCSGKLVNPNQTNEGEARREMCFFHVPFMKERDLFDQFENQMSRFDYAMTASQPSYLTARFTFACESTSRFPSGSRNAAQWQTFVSVGPRKKMTLWSRRCLTAASKSSTSNVTDMPSGETGHSGFLSIANVPAPIVVLDAIRIRTDGCVWFQSQYAFVKVHGRGSCR